MRRSADKHRGQITKLFVMECGKIARSVVYWIFIAVLVMITVTNYGSVAEKEIKLSSDPTSVFYIPEDGVYAPELESIWTSTERQAVMMQAAVKKLMYNYRQNSYECYPLGYIKEKVMSDREQEVILDYLKELTGWDGQTILDGGKSGIKGDGNGTIPEPSAEPTTEELPGTADDVPISGGGAFILKPNQGSMNGNGQFTVEPGNWEYIENGSQPEESDGTEPENGDITVQVSFQRFLEIMENVSRMIGKNSYFSWTMLNLYYGDNDTGNAPATQRQHDEFFQKDRITGAFARYYCDSLALALLWLPAFVVTWLGLKDKRNRMQEIINTHSVPGSRLILIRYAASVCMMMLPVLILPVKSLLTLASYGARTGNPVDLFAFVNYSLGWLLPTVMFVSALSLFITVLTENYMAILVTGAVWLLGKPSVGKLTGGSYDLFDLIIRHNSLKGYDRMVENMGMLVTNRLLAAAAALILTVLSAALYESRRKGNYQVSVKHAKREVIC